MISCLFFPSLFQVRTSVLPDHKEPRADVGVSNFFHWLIFSFFFFYLISRHRHSLLNRSWQAFLIAKVFGWMNIIIKAGVIVSWIDVIPFASFWKSFSTEALLRQAQLCKFLANDIQAIWMKLRVWNGIASRSLGCHLLVFICRVSNILQQELPLVSVFRNWTGNI